MEESDFDQMENDHLDRIFDDDLCDDEICGYYCLNCGKDFDHPAPFHECPWCDCGSIEPIYF